MKINFKHAILACAALVMGFTSCVTNDPKDGEDVVVEGLDTYTQIHLSFPATTRATDAGILAESAVNKVEVFIFKGAQRENYQAWTKADFDGPTNGVYTAKANIKTTSGAKKVYVGINLPDELGASAIVNEAQLTSLAKDITGNKLVKYSGVNLESVAMFSVTPETPTLAPWDGVTGSLPAANTVTVKVQRMVAKAAASEGATLATSLAGMADTYATFTSLQFKVAGVIKDTYIGQNVVGGVIQSPDYAHGTNVTTGMYFDNVNSYVAVNAKDLSTTATTFAAQYAPENTNADVRRAGETTRILVKATVQPKNVWSATGDATVWANWKSTVNAAAASDFFMVEAKTGNQYFFMKATDDATTLTNIGNFINAYNAKFGGSTSDNFNTSRNVGSEIPTNTVVTKYTNGVCYWNKLWLNYEGESNGKGGTTKATANIGQTYRNDFYHMSINNITGIGDGSEGFVDPEIPIIDPESHIQVKMEILPWNYYVTGVDL